MKAYDELTHTAVQAALQAGDFLSKRFGSLLDISSKEGKHNYVTDVDVAVEKIVIDHITSRFSSHSILSEEFGQKSGSDTLWIIDPLDGTLNFIRSVPLFAVSIAVAVAGEIVVGVVYLPMLRELFVGQKGYGTFLNGSKVRVSKTSRLNEAMLVTGTPYHSPQKVQGSIEQFTKMLHLASPVRDLGSAAIDLAYIAAGRFDGYWMPTVQPWDLAAAKCLIEEAGGTFTKYDGSAYREFVEAPIIASNGLLHEALLQQFAGT